MTVRLTLVPLPLSVWVTVKVRVKSSSLFGGSLIGNSRSFTELSDADKAAIAAIAAGFTGLLSLFNIGGRFFWASLSDRLGRKLTYVIFFVLGMARIIRFLEHPEATFLGVG